MNKLNNDKVNSLTSRNNNLHQNRIINAAPSIDPYDYVVRKELDDRIASIEKILASLNITVNNGILSNYAPNILSATVPSIGYGAVGSQQQWIFSSVFTLPTGSPTYYLLKKLKVTLIDVGISPNTRIPIGELYAPYTGSTVTFSSPLIPRRHYDTQFFKFEVESINIDGTPTIPPYLSSSFFITPAPPDTAQPGPQSIVTVTLAESGSRVSNIFGSPYLHITTTVDLASFAGTYQLASFWLSFDGGSNWYFQESHNLLISGGLQVIVTYDKVVPTASNETWQMAVQLGAWNGNPEVSIATAALPNDVYGSPPIFSNTLTVTRVSLCHSTDVTSISFLNYPTTADRFKYGINSNGVADWGWYALQMTLPSISTSYQFFDTVFTVQLGKVVAGVFTPKPDDPEGIERAFGQSSLATFPPGTVGYGQTIIFYGPGATTAWTLPSPYLPGTSTANPYNTFRIKVYANSRREGEPAWQTQQSGWSGGALFFDLVPVNQTGRLDLGTADPITTGGGGGVQIDPNNPNGRPVIVTTNPIYSALPDFGFEFSADGNMTGNVNWGPNGSGSCTVINAGGFSGPRFCRIQGAGEYLSDLYGIPCQYGVPIYASVALRSNNVAAPHSVSLKLKFINNASGVISTVTVGTFSGFQSAWLDKAITGQVFPPAAAWRCLLILELNAAETATGYFDVDDIILQRVLDQVSNGQSQSGVQVSNPTGYSGYNSYHITTTATSYYGLAYAEILASNGDFVTIQCDTGVCQISLTRGVNQAVLDASQLQLGGGAFIATATALRVNSANGRTESLAAAIAAGTRQVVGGIIT